MHACCPSSTESAMASTSNATSSFSMSGPHTCGRWTIQKLGQIHSVLHHHQIPTRTHARHAPGQRRRTATRPGSGGASQRAPPPPPTTPPPPPPGDYTPPGGTFIPPEPEEEPEPKTYNVSEAQLTTGTTLRLSKNDKINVEIQDSSYLITYSSVYQNTMFKTLEEAMKAAYEAYELLTAKA